MLNRAHEIHYQEQVRNVPVSQELVQASNRGTGTAVALSVPQILQRDSDATIAFFPSDHHYHEPSIFRATIDQAFALGAMQSGSSPDYGGRQPPILKSSMDGYEPGHTVVDSSANQLHFVSAFWKARASRMRAPCIKEFVCGIRS